MPWIHSPSVVVRLSLIAMAACASSSSNNAREPGDGSGSDSSIWNQQGSELLATPPALEPFSVPTTGWSIDGAPVQAVAVVDGELMLAGRGGEAASGATFTATSRNGTQVPMRITSVLPHTSPWNGPPSKIPYEYVVEYQHPEGDWRKLCSDDYPAALAIPGSFAIVTRPNGPASNGDYEFATDRLTFSCREGVASKCADWGYPPWVFGGQMSAYFQACTRMARADYCGNGNSRTVEGTYINYGDLHDPPFIRFVPRQGFVPEAVWGAGAGSKGEPAAICLARTRWSTVPIGPRSPCADLMPDPREAGASRKFCDDMTIGDWNAAGALFINTSRMLDAGLHVWTDGAGRYTTTTHFQWHGAGTGAPVPPHFPSFVSVEGSAYKPTPQPPPIDGLVPLFHYNKVVGATRFALTTTSPNPGEGFGDRVLEGYIFGPSPEPPVSTARPLFLYGDGNGGYATLSDPKAPAGFTKVADLGWLPH